MEADAIGPLVTVPEGPPALWGVPVVSQAACREGGHLMDRDYPVKIALATDGGNAARSAVELLARLGRRENLAVTVLSVVPSGQQTLEHAGEMFESRYVRESDARSAMKQAVHRLDGAGFAAKGLLLEGRPDRELAKAIRDHEYELVVIGSGSHSALGRLVLGSVSTYVLNHSPSSVLVVHSVGEAGARARVMLAVDGTPSSSEALGFAARFLDPDRCRVKVVSVVASDPLSVVASPGVYVPLFNEDERQRLRVKAEHIVDEATSRLKALGFDTSSVVADGPVESTLESIRQQWPADLTMVGSRRLNAGQRILLGSIGSMLARRTPATLVVRDNDSVTIDVDDRRTRHAIGV